MKMETREDAVEFVKRFIDEKLEGDIDNFVNYDFASLDKDDEFCCPNKDHDCDDNNIMNAIYVVLWGEQLPDCTYDNIGRGKLYRGDTINTFNTMFGSKAEYFERYNPSIELRAKVVEFKTQICKIGNYLLLPNNTIKIEQYSKTLNTHRGSNHWFDFFDRFLINIDLCLNNSPEQDKYLAELIEKNSFFFNKYNNINDIAELFLLNDFLGKDEKPYEIYNLNYHWRDVNAHEQYTHDAELFISKATELITRRSALLVKALKGFL